ncbi:hypothetical protein L1O03_11230 [Corynebacterium uropygiale]|uniref:Uncharacterized protein n=1 Tax=Corynebacterium uropygiale TaxID=1775911 RepID=A0A9X1QRD1_9CORY|nr:hypothetical protein [Corynebacterium uropygiale]MCF4007736.1 hypothetical protein [Corynebacterium uropygiale]
MRITKKIVATVSAVAVMCSFCEVEVHAESRDASRSEIRLVDSPFQGTLDDQAEAMTTLLEYYESIPDEVLQKGDAAYDQWKEQHPIMATRANTVDCTLAITALIATTAIPVAKIVKIKKLIKALGGVQEAVRIMWGASFSYEKLMAMGGAVKDLVAEIVGYKDVKEKCFQ